MDKEWLESYEAEEQERSRNIAEKLLRQETFDVRSFLSDKTSVGKDSFAYAQGVSLDLLLPFFEQIIVPAGGVPRTPTEFQAQYSFTVEEITGLYRKGIVIPRLVYPTMYLDLDYLDPLLELKPPTSYRNSILLQVFLEKRGIPASSIFTLMSEANSIFRGRFGELTKGFNQHGVKLDQAYVEGQIKNDYIMLKCLGYEQLADRIAGLGNPSSEFLNSSLAAFVLARPIVDGFCGWPQTSEVIFRAAKEAGLPAAVDSAFPQDTAKFLMSKELEKLKVEYPSNVRLDEMLRASGEGAIRRAREALLSFDQASRKELAKEDHEKAMFDKVRVLQDVWDDARTTISRMESATKVGRYATYALALGVLGKAALSFPALPNILDVIGLTAPALAAGGAKKFEFSELLYKLRRRSFPVTLWRLERKITKEG